MALLLAARVSKLRGHFVKNFLTLWAILLYLLFGSKLCSRAAQGNWIPAWERWSPQSAGTGRPSGNIEAVLVTWGRMMMVSLLMNSPPDCRQDDGRRRFYFPGCLAADINIYTDDGDSVTCLVIFLIHFHQRWIETVRFLGNSRMNKRRTHRIQVQSESANYQFFAFLGWLPSSSCLPFLSAHINELIS